MGLDQSEKIDWTNALGDVSIQPADVSTSVIQTGGAYEEFRKMGADSMVWILPIRRILRISNGRKDNGAGLGCGQSWFHDRRRMRDGPLDCRLGSHCATRSNYLAGFRPEGKGNARR